ncbi:MAG: sugar phosphate isomerase/epimerase [Rhizobiales bacterium]|nr:sugar phosphate isomerase/epimerase [Hyphomicrobiales bacterium]
MRPKSSKPKMTAEKVVKDIRHAGLLINKVADDPAGLDELDAAGIAISTIITGGFNLADRSSWEATRAMQRQTIDMAAAHNGHSIYFTSGRTATHDWNADLDLLAEAVAPTVAYGKESGVIAAFEPTLRTSVSFCTTLADAIDVAERTGLGIVADFGNNWMERDLEQTLRRAMPHIALMQIDDIDPAASGGRVHIGEGSLSLKRWLATVLDVGYGGVFDLEVVPADFTAETDETELRAGIMAASRLLDDLGI